MGVFLGEDTVVFGSTQEELAHRAKIHRTYLSDVERGTRNLSLINIERLAIALEIGLPSLFASLDIGD